MLNAKQVHDPQELIALTMNGEIIWANRGISFRAQIVLCGEKRKEVILSKDGQVLVIKDKVGCCTVDSNSPLSRHLPLLLEAVQESLRSRKSLRMPLEH